MKQSKHTPGEWSVHELSGDNIFVVMATTYEKERPFYKNVARFPFTQDKTMFGVKQSQQEAEANAKLIASAPALLEENKQLKQQVQDYAQIINDGDVDKREQGWMQFLAPIINEYKEGSDEPLDGDEVDRLVDIIRAKINLNEGNITQEECEEILNNPSPCDSQEENKKLKEIAKQMGAIIRKLDEDSKYSEFWLNDGNCIPIIQSL